MTRPCTKGTRDSIAPAASEVGAAGPGATGHSPGATTGPPGPRAHPPTGTEPKQTCLVRAGGAKSSPELSRLVDFCLKILWGFKSQAVARSQRKAAELPCRVLGREPGCGAQPRSSLPAYSHDEQRRAPVPPVGHGSATSESSPGRGDGDTDCSLEELDEFFRAESTHIHPPLHGCYGLESNHAPGPGKDAKRACNLSAQICLLPEPRTCLWGWQCVQPRAPPQRIASQFVGCWDFKHCNTRLLGRLRGPQPRWLFCTGKPPASPTSCTQQVLTHLGRDHLPPHTSYRPWKWRCLPPGTADPATWRLFPIAPSPNRHPHPAASRKQPPLCSLCFVYQPPTFPKEIRF